MKSKHLKAEALMINAVGGLNNTQDTTSQVSRVSDPMLNPVSKSIHFLDYLNFVALFDIFLWSVRFRKSTHISMISNSVRHLRSYTNSAIADIAGNSAPISPVTPRRYRR